MGVVRLLRQESEAVAAPDDLVRLAESVNAASDFASLEAAYQSFPHLLFLIGPDDTHVGFRAGRGAEPLVAPDAFLGQRIDAVLPPDVASGILQAVAQVRARRQPIVHEYALDHAGHRRCWRRDWCRCRDDVVASLVIDVTERHAREEALRESTGRLRAILDAEPECVKVVARDGTLLDMNPAGLRMLEAGSLEEARSSSLVAYVGEEHRPAFAALAKRIFAGESGSLSFEIVGRQGTRRWLETNAVPLRDADGTVGAMLGVTRDITERRTAEAALRRSEERFRALIEQASDAISLHDARGRFLFMSPSGESILGYTPEEMRGLDALGLVHPDDVARAAAALEHLLEGVCEPVRFSVRFLTKQGTYRIADVAARNLLHVPAVNAIVANWTDVTERRRLEEQLRSRRRWRPSGGSPAASPTTSTTS